MSAKAKEAFFSALKKGKQAQKLLGGTSNGAGRRIFPSQTPKNDAEAGYRVDQGVIVGGKYKVVVQKNGVPHAEAISTTTVDPSKDSPEDVVKRLEDNWGKSS